LVERTAIVAGWRWWAVLAAVARQGPVKRCYSDRTGQDRRPGPGAMGDGRWAIDDWTRLGWAGQVDDRTATGLVRIDDRRRRRLG
jgi:hypothetical protein